LLPDAAAVLTGSQALTTLISAGGTLDINGTPITVTAGDDSAAIQADINGSTLTTGVTATLDVNDHLVLTSADAKTNITIGGSSTLALLGELGLSAGTTNATNLLTQSAASAGQTLTLTVGANPPLILTFGAGQISTLADLNAALTGPTGLVGGIAAADPNNGNITVTAGNSTDTITVGGTATASNFGIQQRADHALIGHATCLGRALEEIDASARLRERHLHVLLARHQRIWRGQEILHHAHAADFAGGVFNGSAVHGTLRRHARA